TTFHMLPEMSFLIIFLLPIYYFWDSALYKKEDHSKRPVSQEKLGLEGSINLVLLLGVIGAVLFSGFVKMGEFHVYGVHVSIENVIRDIVLLLIAYMSWKLT